MSNPNPHDRCSEKLLKMSLVSRKQMGALGGYGSAQNMAVFLHELDAWHFCYERGESHFFQ